MNSKFPLGFYLGFWKTLKTTWKSYNFLSLLKEFERNDMMIFV